VQKERCPLCDDLMYVHFGKCCLRCKEKTWDECAFMSVSFVCVCVQKLDLTPSWNMHDVIDLTGWQDLMHTPTKSNPT